MPLSRILDSLSGLRAVVVGDLMLDHYIHGRVRRISPEAPVPVLEVQHDTFSGGGAANVALNLAALGISTCIVGYLAQDDAGARLGALLANSGIASHALETAKSPPTIIKARVVAHNQQVCRVDREASALDYRPASSDANHDLVKKLFASAELVIFSDYAKGVLGQDFFSACVAICNSLPHLLTALDPKPSHPLAHRGMGLMTPNLGEAAALAGLPPDATPDSLELICRAIHEIYHPLNLVVTLGADGMALSTEGRLLKTMPTHAQEVFDVSGAGDTVIAVLASALAGGASLEDAADLANRAAGCVVAHAGTVPVNCEELKSFLL